jgi:hypothetical protein
VFFIPNIYREVLFDSVGRAAFGGSPNRASNRQHTGGLLSVSVLGRHWRATWVRQNSCQEYRADSRTRHAVVVTGAVDRSVPGGV